MKPVLVDMDGVLAHFDKAIMAAVSQAYPEFDPSFKWKEFYITDNFKQEELKTFVRKIKIEPGFFRYLPIVDNALEGIHRILDLGYHVRICSAPLLSNPTCKQDKLDWLQEYIAPHVPIPIVEEAYITKVKHKSSGIALIDDRPTIKHSEKADWVHIVFDRSYNQKVETDFRLVNWLDPNLEELLAKAAEISERKSK